MRRSKKEIEKENWNLTMTILEQQIKINNYEKALNNIREELIKTNEINKSEAKKNER